MNLNNGQPAPVVVQSPNNNNTPSNSNGADWEQAITPVLDRLQRLEAEIQQQMNSAHDKQTVGDMHMEQ